MATTDKELTIQQRMSYLEKVFRDNNLYILEYKIEKKPGEDPPAIWVNLEIFIPKEEKSDEKKETV